MNRSREYAMVLVMSGMMAMSALAGEASTSASAGNRGGGNAAATANYVGDGLAGLARTRTRTGAVNAATGLAVGVDSAGLDFSFGHAIAGQRGPAYAGTFNLSIGNNGQVSGSYGGVVAQGGAVRDVAAGGATRSSPGGTSTAFARGNTFPGGTVQANPPTYNRPAQRVVRPVAYRPIVIRQPARLGRR